MCQTCIYIPNIPWIMWQIRHSCIKDLLPVDCMLCHAVKWLHTAVHAAPPRLPAWCLTLRPALWPTSTPASEKYFTINRFLSCVFPTPGTSIVRWGWAGLTIQVVNTESNWSLTLFLLMNFHYLYFRNLIHTFTFYVQFHQCSCFMQY